MDLKICRKRLLVAYIVLAFIMGGLSGLLIHDTPEFGESEAENLIPLDHTIPVDEMKIMKNLQSMGGFFTENQGQIGNDDVRYYSQGGGLWFTDDGVWFDIKEENEKDDGINLDDPFYDPSFSEYPEPRNRKGVILKQEFVGSNVVQPIGKEDAGYYSNFFYGNDSSKWKTEVSSFKEINYLNIYDGIDLKYYTNERGLKYDFIVHPGANVEDIHIKWVGAEEVSIEDDKNIMIQTSYGIVKENNLFIYQNDNGIIREIDGRFNKIDNFEFGFQLEADYIISDILIIDPELEYSTFLGGSNDEYIGDIVVDDSGYVYLIGRTESPNFPNTTYANDTSYNGGLNGDAFISKLNRNGTALIYSTFLGGTSNDYGSGIALGKNGSIYGSGSTDSNDFPVTLGANDTSLNGYDDIFVLKLNSNGSGLFYSTYIGGSNDDSCSGIVVDSSGNVTLAGRTRSYNFVVTPGALYSSHNGGFYDGILFKLNHNGTSLIYSSYIGGSNWDWCSGITTDIFGNIFITGITESSNFPITSGCYDQFLNGNRDIFILQINSNGTDLIYSTFIGGSGTEGVGDIAIDEIGNAYITGETHSTDFPYTPGSYRTIGTGIYILKLNENGSALKYSTSIGSDRGTDILVDSEGNAIITGIAGTFFPTTPGSFDMTHNNDWDAFLLKINESGSKLLYSTFIGGSNEDQAYDISMDLNGSVYISGFTDSSNFPVTENSFDESHNGGDDGFILKFSFNHSMNITSISFLKDQVPLSQAYSTYGHYTFQINITDTASIHDLEVVNLTLEHSGNNIHLIWSQLTGQFTKILDPNDYITLEPTSIAINDSHNNWTINFNVTFNWNFPDEILHSVSVNATSYTMGSILSNSTDLYQVENDLDFLGNLLVSTPRETSLQSGSWVKTGETINWTGLQVVYQGTTDIYPPNNEFNVTIWDDDGDYWFDQNSSGRQIFITTNSDDSTDDSDLHTINITGIPLDCDLSDINFELLVDGSNLTFYDPIPSPESWQRNSQLVCGISCSDLDAAIVDGPSIEYRKSNTNGSSWSDWIDAGETQSASQMDVSIQESFPDGTENLIQWRGQDVVSNGPHISEEYPILVDTIEVRFTDPTPHGPTNLNPDNMLVGITIQDNTSGVNHSSIEYSIKKHGQSTWSPWQPPESIQSNGVTYVETHTDFDEGENNYIKWRAKDVAGNGPTESEEYLLLIDSSNITFTNPTPNLDVWQTSQSVTCGITITDVGFAGINASTIAYRVSSNDEMDWTPWTGIASFQDTSPMIVSAEIGTFIDGDNNLIQWRAEDLFGNGPKESEEYRIKLDRKNVVYLDFWPPKSEELFESEVVARITISDETSGVNSSTVKYASSNDAGMTWGDWIPVNGFENENEINVKVNLTLQHGYTWIKWRSMDIAGNGPIESQAYRILVFIQDGDIDPKPNYPPPEVRLIDPPNGSAIVERQPILTWSQVSAKRDSRNDIVTRTDYNLTPITYDIYFGTENNIKKFQTGLGATTYKLEYILELEETYYWKILPRRGNISGNESETWSFKVISESLKPAVTLKTPYNGEIIKSKKPTLTWSTNYSGFDIVTYDVYLGNSSELEKVASNMSLSQYVPDINLENNRTYYWKIIPQTKIITGLESEIWSFTITNNSISPYNGNNITNENKTKSSMIVIAINSAFIVSIGIFLFYSRIKNRKKIKTQKEKNNVLEDSD